MFDYFYYIDKIPLRGLQVPFNFNMGEEINKDNEYVFHLENLDGLANVPSL